MKPANVALSVVLAATIAGHLAIGADPALPNRDYLPEMVYSPAAESFAASPLLPGGRVMQAAPAGTVSRQASLVRYEPTPADAVRAGEELTAPAQAPGDPQRGATVYTTFCTPCHGGSGLGDGPVAKRGFPAPPSLLAPRAVGMRDGQVFHVLTYGQMNMPGYAAQISEPDRWRVVAHVRGLQRNAR